MDYDQDQLFARALIWVMAAILDRDDVESWVVYPTHGDPE